MFRNLGNRLANLVAARTDGSALQSQIDWFRFALLSQVHRGCPPEEALDKLVEQAPSKHIQQAIDHYSAELNRLIHSLHSSTDGQGVKNVYPPALPGMNVPAAPSGEALLQHRAKQQQRTPQVPDKRRGAVETRTHRHPDGFQLVIRRSGIEHPEAGYGLYVDGVARAGTLLALYPGRVLSPPELKPSVVNDNEYMISFYSGWVIDGREWHRRGERFEERLDAVIRGGMAPPSDASDLLKYRNPLGVANYINHPPPDTKPNVACCELELDTLDDTVKLWIPNDSDAELDMMSRYVWHNMQHGTVRMMAAIALHDLHNCECFLNYRYNPTSPFPDWYHDPDPEASARRWTPAKLL